MRSILIVPLLFGLLLAVCDAGDADYATMRRVCAACADLAEPPALEASMWSRGRELLFGHASPTSMSEGCFAAVRTSCAKFRTAAEITDPSQAMQVMALLSNFAYCRGWSATKRQDVSLSEHTHLVEWRDRACNVHDEL